MSKYSKYIATAAEFSDDEVYRYALMRQWGDGPCLAVIGLNPSTADADNDDPTIRRCVGFARTFGCGQLLMLNLFAYRAKDPSELLRANDPIGPLNDDRMKYYVERCPSDFRVAAWGAGGVLLGRSESVSSFLPPLQCMGVTKNGQPRHPLYLASKTRLAPWAHP